MDLQYKNTLNNKNTIELVRTELSGNIVKATIEGDPTQTNGLLDSFFLAPKSTQLKSPIENKNKDTTEETNCPNPTTTNSPPSSYNEYTNSRGRSTVDLLEPKDFKGKYLYSEEKLNNLNIMAENLPTAKKVGIFDSEKDYINSLDLFMAAGFEREHLEEIIIRMITPRLKDCKEILDIGVGNGDLSKLIDGNCEFVTAIDNKQEALNNLPNKMGSSFVNNVDKIKGTILDTEVLNKGYDFIVLSHMLYYIEEKERIKLIDKLYNLLSEKGTILIIYNDNGDREPLAEHFGGKRHSFLKTREHIQEKYVDKYFYQSPEILKAKNFEAASHLMATVLNDDETSTTPELARDYADKYLQCEEGYCIGMTQNIIMISNYKGNIYAEDSF